MLPFRLSILLVILSFVSCSLGEQEQPQPVNRPAPMTHQSNQPCININTASADELMQLPGIGEVMSQKIIEHRKLHGPFRRPQDLIIIEGFSERKYRAIAALVCVE
jgi:competence ComEA-like helix-hairpin-helix protein